MRTISIIYSCLNEEAHGYVQKIALLPQTLDRAQFQFIAVDGGSQDQTTQFLNDGGWTVLSQVSSNRAARYNKGLERADHEVVLLHHPRSLLETEGYLALTQIEKGSWGAYTHCFDTKGFGYEFTSWYSNCVRGDLRGIFYLDHCLFVDRTLLLEVGGVPEVDIFEDTKLCEKLREVRHPQRLPAVSTTSAVRFEHNGFVKQAVLNQWLKLKYLINFDDKSMYTRYETGLDLNGQKEKGPQNEPNETL